MSTVWTIELPDALKATNQDYLFLIDDTYYFLIDDIYKLIIQSGVPGHGYFPVIWTEQNLGQ